MFGKNKMSQNELELLQEKVKCDDALFAQLDGTFDSFEAGVEEIRDADLQIDVATKQIGENIKAAYELAEDNVRMEAELLHHLTEMSDKAVALENSRQGMMEDLRKVSEESTQLVEENKHLTSPSRYLSELAGNLRMQNRSYQVQLEQMTEYGKQMSVMSLNAAIEAGRMGENAQQFVQAAENIRSYAANYDKASRELHEEIEDSNRKIDDLEEQLKLIINLLKENNVAMVKLMKTCHDAVKNVEKNQVEPLDKDITFAKTQVTILKNDDEEILKSEERNRIRMEDIATELETQRKTQKDILNCMEPVFRHVVERKNME